MKTALKIIGGIIATLLAAVAIFYFGWLSPPDPEDVCDNVMELTKKELQSKGGSATDAQLAELRTQCIDRAGTAPEFGRGPWVKRLKCMRDAESFPELEACEQIRSM